MNPLVLVAGLGGAAALLGSRKAPVAEHSHIGAVLAAPLGLQSHRVVVPVSGAESKVLNIPVGTKAVSIYNRSNTGPTIYGHAFVVQVRDALKEPLLTVDGATLLALGATTFMPQGARSVVMRNSAGANTADMNAIVIFHVQP